MFLLGGLCNVLSKKLDCNYEKNALHILPHFVLLMYRLVEVKMVLSRVLKSKTSITACSFHNLKYTKYLQNGIIYRRSNQRHHWCNKKSFTNEERTLWAFIWWLTVAIFFHSLFFVTKNLQKRDNKRAQFFLEEHRVAAFDEL